MLSRITDYISSLVMSDDCNMFNFETYLWHLYRNREHTDVNIELETSAEPLIFSAHKMVLAMWSPRFEDIFYKREMKTDVFLKDVNPQAFEDMLKFMYGCDPVLNSYKEACELLKVAAEFGVTHLMTLCQNYLTEVDIEVSNIFDFLEIAERMQNRSLIDKCMKLIQTETKSVLAYYDCSYFSESMVQIILNSPTLSLDSEFELIVWIFAWGKNILLEHSIYSSLRDVLDSFLPQLNFLALTNVQFTNICTHHEDFFSHDEALRIFMNIGIPKSKPMPGWHDQKSPSREYTGEQDDLV